jgi:putative protease
MKILAPLSAVAEVEPLAKAGAEEFYCGVTPPEWIGAHGAPIWLNRRHPKGANLPSLEALGELVARAGALGIPVFLTLNAPTYTGEVLPYLMALARTCVEDLGVRALIVSDLSLLFALREAGLAADLHLSSLASCFNREAVAWYQDLGVIRVVLPRQVALPEVRALAIAHPAMELEVFVLNDGCFFEEGFCSTTHHLGPFCMTPWDWRLLDAPAARAQRPDVEAWEGHWKDFREFLWYTDNCGSSVNPKGLPNGPCALCALHDLVAAGVASAKIVGREASLLRKMASVQLVHAALKRIRAGASKGETNRFAVAARATPEFCRSGYMCYYRDDDHSRMIALDGVGKT